MDPIIFLIFLASCMGAGVTGAVFPPGEWYKSLAKPSWTPPNWAFPVAWTTIYLCISFAGARVVWLDGNGYAFAFFAAQVAFATLWTPVFFGLRRLKGSILIMGALWLSVFGTTVAMFQLDIWAGIAFLPYITWVTVAAALNISVARLNPEIQPVDLSKI